MPNPFQLESADEYMHSNSGESNFNESMYFNFFDFDRKQGGFLRIGNRPNEGFAETTLCLFRPGRDVLFQFARPENRGNDRFEAGGVHFEVEEPFERLRVSYRGRACRLVRPMEMADPRRAFASNPSVPVEIDLAIRAVAPACGGERRAGATGSHETEFARGHYEQHHRASGTLEIDGERSAFDGLGLRDHSWGPRSWQAPRYYRWLTASFGDDWGFAATWIAGRDGSEIRGGFVHRDGKLTLLRDVSIETEWVGDERVHDRIVASLHCADGEVLNVEGRVLSLIPLRNRRGGRTTRISEGLTEWTCNRRTGYGLSEYLDQLD